MQTLQIYVFGIKAKCPECSGLMSKIGAFTMYRCNDCGSTFRVEELDKREDYFLGKKLEMTK